MFDGWKELWDEGDAPMRAALLVAGWNLALAAFAALPLNPTIHYGLMVVGVAPFFVVGLLLFYKTLMRRFEKRQAPGWVVFGPKPRPIPRGPIMMTFILLGANLGCFVWAARSPHYSDQATRPGALTFLTGAAFILVTSVLVETKVIRYLRGPNGQ